MNAGCSEYRGEMLLLALRRRLSREDLEPEDRRRLEAEVKRLETELGLD